METQTNENEVEAMVQERYHEWILRRIKEENMTEEWERSFLPLDDPMAVQPPICCPCCDEVYNTCNHCGQVYPQFVEIKQTVFIGQDEVTLRYCSQACREEHYLKRLHASDGKV